MSVSNCLGLCKWLALSPFCEADSSTLTRTDLRSRILCLRSFFPRKKSVNHPSRILFKLVLAMGFVTPVAMAQKPPGPPPAPSRPATPLPSSSQPTQPDVDVVTFLMGRVATNDGTPVPNDLSVERVCNNRVRQQVHATPSGDFSMEIGSKADFFVDASGGPGSQEGEARKDLTGGIPRRELANCELRTSAAGFRPTSISLMDLTPSGGAINVGAIVVQRATKLKGTTLSARPYKAPPNARKAYEKGVEAERNGRLPEARKYFEQAAEIYPGYASAWFQLGAVLEKENEKDLARAAYSQATAVDTRFLPPYLSLASMAYRAGNWTEVLQYTNHIIDRDLLNYGNVAGYILDLDEWNSAGPYFYNAVANYKLNKIDEAEKSALKAEHLDLSSSFPQLHLLLAEVFARKEDYAVAISELQAYLELVPHAKDGDLVREWLAGLKKLSRPAPGGEKPD